MSLNVTEVLVNLRVKAHRAGMEPLRHSSDGLSLDDCQRESGTEYASGGSDDLFEYLSLSSP